MEALLQPPHPADRGLLLIFGHSNKRRRERDRVLPRRPQGVLHRLPGHEHQLLTMPLLVLGAAASVVAGLSTLFGP
jgi:hypothetical protein